MPNTHQLLYSQGYKQALFLIITPCISVFAFVAIILQFDDVPGWLLLVLTFAVVGVNILFVIKLFFKWMFIACECRAEDRGLWLRITGRSPFYSLTETLIPWEQIRTASMNDNVSEGTGKINMQYFVLIKTDVPGHKKFMLFPQKGGAPIADFWQDAEAHITQYNEQQPDVSSSIKDLGYYDQPWAKVLFAISALLVGLSVLVSIFNLFSGEDMDWLLVIKMLTFSSLFMIPYYVNKKRKKHK